MKTFRTLTVECWSADERPDIKSFVDVVMQLTDNGWSRDTQREQELKSGHSLELYCFACSGKNKRKAARLFLGSSGGCIRITNIVPDEVNELSYDEYNLIMSEFNEGFVKPAAERLGYRTVLTGDEERIEDFLTRVLRSCCVPIPVLHMRGIARLQPSGSDGFSFSSPLTRRMPG